MDILREYTQVFSFFCAYFLIRQKMLDNILKNIYNLIRYINVKEYEKTYFAKYNFVIILFVSQ